MKTIFDEINEIKSSNRAKSAKKRALVSLGLTNQDADLILFGLPKVARVSRPTYTFGVEIECGVMQGALRDAASQTGLSYQHERYNHTDGHSYYKFVSDGSLRIEGAIECVSPVLKGNNGLKSLKNVCQTLNVANARVNSTCGLHVHIAVNNMTDDQYVNTFVNYYYLESLIDSFMAPTRRNNTYAKSLRSWGIIRLAECRTKSDVRNLLGTRYVKVNPCSYNAHGTIEFRQHQGSTNYEKISKWVSFCGKLVLWSKENRFTAPVRSIDDVPFLNDAEKCFFKARIAQFSNN